MNKKEMFLMLVQTWCTAMAAARANRAITAKGMFKGMSDSCSERRGTELPHYETAISCVAQAGEIPEGDIPDDIEQACSDFMRYMDGETNTDDHTPRPVWWKK